MRCVVALMQHETNTFSPLATPLHAFASGVGLSDPPCGDQAVEIYGSTDLAFAALLDVAKARNTEISVPVAAYAEPSGKVDDDAYETIVSKICEDVAKGCDAVLLDLHGAMVTHSYDDGEGELLKRIRQINAKVPIFEKIAKHIVLAAGPGVCSSDYTQFRFKNLPGPVYSLDLESATPRTGCQSHYSTPHDAF